MPGKSLLRLLGRIAVLAGGTLILALMFTIEVHPLWWVLAGIPTGLALLFYVAGREAQLEPYFAERQAGPLGRLLRIAVGVLAFYLLFGDWLVTRWDRSSSEWA